VAQNGLLYANVPLTNHSLTLPRKRNIVDEQELATLLNAVVLGSSNVNC